MNNFYDENPQALRPTSVTLRDSLGVLAIEILKSQKDISKMSYDEILDDLMDLIEELHEAYQHKNY